MKSLVLLLVLAASTAYGEIYTWKDSRGTTHYANSVYEIPQRYRSRVKVLNLGEPQKTETPPPPQATPAPQVNLTRQPATAPPASVVNPGMVQRHILRRKQRQREEDSE